MTNCYNCAFYMVSLSEKLRMVNEGFDEDCFLQDDIDRLMIALDNHGHASNIAHVLHQDIQGASAVRLIPLLQCAVRSVVKLQGDILACFENWLPDSMEDVFENLCDQRKDDTKTSLVFLRIGWQDIFSRATLKEMDTRLRRLDADWPVFKISKRAKKLTVPEKVRWMLPPITYKSLVMPRSPLLQLSLNRLLPPRSPLDRPSLTPATEESPRARIAEPPPPQSPDPLTAKEASPRVATSEDSDKRSSPARFQPTQFAKPPNARQSTTETRLGRSSVGSYGYKGTGSLYFYRQIYCQNLAYNVA
ncbi:uncharacterized protein LOC131665183 [Phymastichus coffea]|uniref:uncharacterized protein LOC131665183 n=1 Tax=Phymastichus coffea TaxID=108790 RepID=UPI00273B06C2|nr:uncharacterized protein LOC131665183 [Phymastichus coffea]